MQQRTIIASDQILCSNGAKSSEMYGRMTFYSVDNYMNQGKVYERMGRFKGYQMCTDGVGSEQLSTVPCVRATELIDQSIWDNLVSSTDDTKSVCMLCRTGSSWLVFAKLSQNFVLRIVQGASWIQDAAIRISCWKKNSATSSYLVDYRSLDLPLSTLHGSLCRS
jgi:hypothetical protein